MSTTIERSIDRTSGRRPGRRPAQRVAPAALRDEVLVPVIGILDIVDSHGFIRTSGYLPAPGDPRVPPDLMHRYGLRRGDHVEGMAAQQEGPRRATRIDLVNGRAADDLAGRPHFADLTPIHPQQRLRLETEQNRLATRVIDLVAPIGKGQRGLLVAPPKAGKTMILQALADAITRNHPECHLMVILLDERPEEVTDMRRSVSGEVLSSTFDRPARDHTTLADLAIERAKRMVELGQDVVILLDSVTRLCRAHNAIASGNGRTLSGGVDAAALQAPKRLFGAARNIEHGGSLTILATALVDTGSRADDYFFEELKGTGNMELRLDRTLADRRIFPAIDVTRSGTRKEELLTSTTELTAMHRLRRVLQGQDAYQGAELMVQRVKQSASNADFLQQILRTVPEGRPGSGS
jgi:transcription termination factor Rho